MNSDDEERRLAQVARPAARVFTDVLTGMRSVLADDLVYLAMMRQVRGWLIGQEAWLTGILGPGEPVGAEMQVEHRLAITALCPANGQRDDYQCVVRCERFLAVEEILIEAAAFRGVTLYQESLTAQLAETLGCEVETVGVHSGVTTKVICRAYPRKRIDGHGAQAGPVVSLPVVGAPADPQESQQREVASGNGSAVGNG